MNNWGIRHETINTYMATCYISKKLLSTEDEWGNEIVTYDTPVEYYFDIQPVTNTSEATVFGELTPRMKCAVIPKNLYLGKINEFDLAYLDGESPKDETFNGENANYRVYSIQPQNAMMKVYFLKIIKGGENL